MSFIIPPDAPDDLKAYPFKTAPFQHQWNGLLMSYRKPAFALTWEPRCGKTKPTIDTAALAFLRGSINGLGVVAPKGVDRNWLEDEIPMHMPDEIPRMCLLYRANDADKVWWKNAYKDLLRYDGLSVLAINVDSTSRANGRTALQKFLEQRRTFLSFDESADGKTPNSARTKALYHLSKRAKAKRILDGTPAAENPLELFAQYRFLDPMIFGTSYAVFKARYAVYETAYAHNPNGPDREYQKLKEYAHLDELMAKIAPITDRVQRADVFDMPDKIYQKERYQLSDEQQRVYGELRELYRTELASGAYITAANVLVRYLRLQQVLSNRFPSERFALCTNCHGEGCEKCEGAGVIENKNRDEGHIIDTKKNPRIDALNRVIGTSRARKQPTIVWCRFRTEATDIVNLAREHGRRVARYDGSCTDDEKFKAKRGFQAGDIDFIVGNQAAGGRGITLSKGQLLVYYSNYFSLRQRLQSEDRAEAPGKKEGTDIVDLVAEGTIDEDVISALRGKKALSDMIMGDTSRVWL